MENMKTKRKSALNFFTNNRYGKRMQFLFKVAMVLIIGLVLVPISAVVMGVTGATGSLVTAIAVILAAITGVSFWVLVIGFICSIPFLISKKSITQLARRNILEQAVNEFQTDSLKPIPKTKNKFSNNFLYYSAGRVEYLKDILWVYKQTEQTNVYGITASKIERVLAGMKNGKLLLLLTGNSKSFDISNIDGLFQQIKQINPSVLIGFTDENKKLYKQLVKSEKNII